MVLCIENLGVDPAQTSPTFKPTLLTIIRKYVVSFFYPSKNQCGVILGNLNISKYLNKITTISHWKGQPRPSPNTLPRHTIPKPIFLMIFRSRKVCPFFTPHPKSGAKTGQMKFFGHLTISLWQSFKTFEKSVSIDIIGQSLIQICDSNVLKLNVSCNYPCPVIAPCRPNPLLML